MYSSQLLLAFLLLPFTICEVKIVRTRFQLGRARIDVVTLKEATDWVLKAASTGTHCSYVVTPNSDHLVMLEHDVGLQKAYASAHLVIADGMPLVWASKLLGPALPERVTGSELMPLVCAGAAQRGLPIFLLGAGPGVAERAKERLERAYPGLSVVGTYSPPLGFGQNPLELERIVGLLRASAAAIVFVGLGAPKQELWMHANYQKLGAGVLLGIGAGIDFSAGNVQRAPIWMQKSGIEWIFRLAQEPRRLARRYLRDTLIAWIIVRELWQKICHLFREKDK